jgi:Rod binding domain-containing protein
LSGPIAPGLPGSSPSSLQSLHKGEQKLQHDPAIRKAAEGFEAMFLDYMMQVMRKTVPENEMDLENGASKIYRSMLDSEYAQKAVHQGGVGLADQIVAYLESQQYNLKRDSKDSGGSDAGQSNRK